MDEEHAALNVIPCMTHISWYRYKSGSLYRNISALWLAIRMSTWWKISFLSRHKALVFSWKQIIILSNDANKSGHLSIYLFKPTLFNVAAAS